MILFKRKYSAIFLLIPIVLLKSSYLFLHYDEIIQQRVGEIFLSHIFGGSYNMEEIDMAVSVVGLIGIIYITMLLADYVVGDLFETADYLFVRYKSRAYWYRKKIIGVIFYCSLGIFLYLIFYVLYAVHISTQKLETTDIFLILSTYLILDLFTICSVLAVNLLCIDFQITQGYILFYGMVLLSTGLTYIMNGAPDSMAERIALKINPMSNILVSWNFGNAEVLWSLGYYLTMTAFLTFCLWHRVKEIGADYRKDEKGKMND